MPGHFRLYLQKNMKKKECMEGKMSRQGQLSLTEGQILKKLSQLALPISASSC